MQAVLVQRLYRTTSIISVLLLGLMAGFFFAFAVDVAPAMTHLDASDYIAMQQAINRVVRNAVFGGVYFGSVVLPFVVVLLAVLKKNRSLMLAWAVIALGYGVLVFGVTRSINIPINDALALWNPAQPPSDWMQARDTWNQGNLIRAFGAVVCFAVSVLVMALSAPDKQRKD